VVKIEWYRCAKCTSAMDLKYTNTTTRSEAINARLLGLHLLYHSKYPSFTAPRAYPGFTAGNVLMVVNESLSYADLLALLSIASKSLTIRVLGDDFTITSIPRSFYCPENGQWLVRLASRFLERPQEEEEAEGGRKRPRTE
jgi:hypothetical protein